VDKYQDLIGKRFNKLTVLKYSHYTMCKNGRYMKKIRYWTCRCDCGTTVTIPLSDLNSGHTKTYGHCNDPKLYDRFGKLKIIKIHKGKTGGAKIEALCDCGNVWKGHPYVLRSGKTKTCGHCYDPKVGNIFGRLQIIEVYPNIKGGGGCRIKAQCNCGNFWEGKANILMNGNTISCGNCQLKRNGLFTSQKALELHTMLGNYGEHNGKIGKYYGDIVLKNSNIVIEYDGWYWHKDRLNEDQKRLRKLRYKGWKTLQIKTSRYLPTQQQLDKALFELIMTNAKQRTITLPGWNKD
jgi:very-short-patch-repair endonuclease